MDARVHRSWWQSVELRHRRHRLQRCRINRKSLLQRCILGIWCIFGSTDFPLTDQGGHHSAWTAPLVSAQIVDASESYSASCDGHQHPRPGAIYSAVGHLNYGVGLDLQADIGIPGACEVNFPIDVSSSYVRLVHGQTYYRLCIVNIKYVCHTCNTFVCRWQAFWFSGGSFRTDAWLWSSFFQQRPQSTVL